MNGIEFCEYIETMLINSESIKTILPQEVISQIRTIIPTQKCIECYNPQITSIVGSRRLNLKKLINPPTGTLDSVLRFISNVIANLKSNDVVIISNKYDTIYTLIKANAYAYLRFYDENFGLAKNGIDTDKAKNLYYSLFLDNFSIEAIKRIPIVRQVFIETVSPYFGDVEERIQDLKPPLDTISVFLSGYIASTPIPVLEELAMVDLMEKIGYYPYLLKAFVEGTLTQEGENAFDEATKILLSLNDTRLSQLKNSPEEMAQLVSLVKDYIGLFAGINRIREQIVERIENLLPAHLAINALSDVGSAEEEIINVPKVNASVFYRRILNKYEGFLPVIVHSEDLENICTAIFPTLEMTCEICTKKHKAYINEKLIKG